MKFHELLRECEALDAIIEAAVPKPVELSNRVGSTIGKASAKAGSVLSRLGAKLGGRTEEEEDKEKRETPPPPAVPQPAPPVPPAVPPTSPQPQIKTPAVTVPAPKAPTIPPVPPVPSAQPPPTAPTAPPTAPKTPATVAPPRVSGYTPAVPTPAVPKSVEDLKKPSAAPTAPPIHTVSSNLTLVPQIRLAIKSHTDRGRVVVNFRKIDGTLRRMVCTTNLKLVPAEKWPTSGKSVPPGNMAVYDFEKEDWRQFVLLRVINLVSADGQVIFFNGHGPASQV